jgi:hypothetical protein
MAKLWLHEGTIRWVLTSRNGGGEPRQFLRILSIVDIVDAHQTVCAAACSERSASLLVYSSAL